MKKLLMITSLLLALNGCVPFIAGAAVGGTGAAVANDKRSVRTIRDDQTISYQIEQKVHADAAPTAGNNISAATFNHVVLLVGQVPTEEARQYADEVAQNTDKVRRVYNEITIGDNTSVGQRSRDAFITAKAKTKMLATDNLRSTQIKVVTENSVIYLMGEISQAQAHMATQVVRKIPGVKKVVKVFDYTDGE